MGNVGRIARGDIELEFESEGDESGATLLLVHGFTGSRDDFREQLPLLARHGRTIALDQRGHGGSSNPGRPNAYTFDELVADLAAFVDSLGDQGGEPIDLLGHSMGGMVAIRYALTHPERVRSLVLMDTAPGPIGMLPKALREGSVRFARSQGMGKLADMMRSGMEKAGARSPSAAACIERMGPDVFFARIKRKLEQMDIVAFDVIGALLGEHESVAERLAEIDVPTLVIVGEEDGALRPGADALAAGIPNAHLEVIPDAEHSPQLENPSAWLAAVEAHLGRVRGAP